AVLTKAPGLHSAKFSKDHSVYVRTSVLLGAMPRSTVHRADGTLVGPLPSVAEAPPFTPEQRLEKVGTAPGFSASVVRPRDFAKGTKYPVIVYVYGGPGHQHVLASMGSRLIPQWLADQGFIVVSIDNRGTPGRGRDWERALSKKFGSVPLDD